MEIQVSSPSNLTLWFFIWIYPSCDLQLLHIKHFFKLLQLFGNPIRLVCLFIGCAEAPLSIQRHESVCPLLSIK